MPESGSERGSRRCRTAANAVAETELLDSQKVAMGPLERRTKEVGHGNEAVFGCVLRGRNTGVICCFRQESCGNQDLYSEIR